MIRHLTEVVDKARELRRQKLSFQEISKSLGVPSGTIRHWCYDLGIERHEALRINNEYRRNSIRELDANLFPSLLKITPEQARLFTALLYGCEGSRYPATGGVSFVNSDPNLVKLFVNLLKRGFDLDENKFRVHLQVHNSHNFMEVKKFWSKLLKIPESQFLKPTITTPRGKMRRQNYLGTCSLRYQDYRIQLRLLGIFDKFCTKGGVA